MEERRFQRLLHNPATFKDVDHLSYIELQSSEMPTTSHFRKGTMSETETVEWLEHNAQNQKDQPFEGLRILACTSIMNPDSRIPLALSRSTYEAISHSWQIPQSFLYLLSTRTSCFLSFESSAGNVTGHVFQTIDKNGRPFAYALSQSSYLKQINILLYGLLPEEFDVICDEFFSFPRLATCPTFLPICLLDLVNEVIEHDLERCRAQTHEIMIELGMAKTAPEDVYIDCSLHHCNFIPITRGLTGLTANLAKCELACEAHLLLLDQLDEEFIRWLTTLDHEHHEKMERETTVLKKRSDGLRKWMQAMRPRTQYLTKRSQAYVQTVYSLMAQKDNALNMQTAEASLRISEASYRDSAAMIALAEDSKQIAVATSRDSSSMFIISALTLIYLPSTFTATLFSTQFFDLTNSNTDSMTSSRFWLYWAVTVPLTVITAACAAYFWKMRDRRLRDTFVWCGTALARMEKGINEIGSAAEGGQRHQ